MSLKEFRLFGTHLHIIDSRFSLTPNNGYLPDSFTSDDYLKRMQGYTPAGGAVSQVHSRPLTCATCWANRPQPRFCMKTPSASIVRQHQSN